MNKLMMEVFFMYDHKLVFFGALSTLKYYIKADEKRKKTNPPIVPEDLFSTRVSAYLNLENNKTKENLQPTFRDLTNLKKFSEKCLELKSIETEIDEENLFKLVKIANAALDSLEFFVEHYNPKEDSDIYEILKNVRDVSESIYQKYLTDFFNTKSPRSLKNHKDAILNQLQSIKRPVNRISFLNLWNRYHTQMLGEISQELLKSGKSKKMKNPKHFDLSPIITKYLYLQLSEEKASNSPRDISR